MWESIKGYEDFYMISNNGQVNSLYRGIIMKTFVNNSGYECIKLRKDREPKNFTVHSLVAHHFVGGYGEGKEVDHKDCNKLNNKSSNLRWVTRKGNMQHTIKNGNFNITAAQERAKEVNKKPVMMLEMDGRVIREYDSIKSVVEDTGLLQSKISLVCNGKRKTTGGYRWSFRDKTMR